MLLLGLVVAAAGCSGGVKRYQVWVVALRLWMKMMINTGKMSRWRHIIARQMALWFIELRRFVVAAALVSQLIWARSWKNVDLERNRSREKQKEMKWFFIKDRGDELGKETFWWEYTQKTRTKRMTKWNIFWYSCFNLTYSWLINFETLFIHGQLLIIRVWRKREETGWRRKCVSLLSEQINKTYCKMCSASRGNNCSHLGEFCKKFGNERKNENEASNGREETTTLALDDCPNERGQQLEWHSWNSSELCGVNATQHSLSFFSIMNDCDISFFWRTLTAFARKVLFEKGESEILTVVKGSEGQINSNFEMFQRN